MTTFKMPTSSVIEVDRRVNGLGYFMTQVQGHGNSAVPNLTFCADIKLNERVSLQLHREYLRYFMKTGAIRLF